MGEKEGEVRSVSLRPAAFLGESVEPLRLRLQGLNLASIPEGVVRPSLHFTTGRGSRVPSALCLMRGSYQVEIGTWLSSLRKGK